MDTMKTVAFCAQALVTLDELALAALALGQVRELDEVERRRQLRIQHDARLALYRAARAVDDGRSGVPLAERLRAYDEDPMGVMRSPVDDATFFEAEVRVTMPAMIYLMRTRRAAYYGLAEAGMLRIATVAHIPWEGLQRASGRDLLSELARKMINIQARSAFSVAAPAQLPAPPATGVAEDGGTGAGAAAVEDGGTGAGVAGADTSTSEVITVVEKRVMPETMPAPSPLSEAPVITASEVVAETASVVVAETKVVAETTVLEAPIVDETSVVAETTSVAMREVVGVPVPDGDANGHGHAVPVIELDAGSIVGGGASESAPS